MERAIIERVQGFGFDVYMRKNTDTYLLFTDGTRIGYMQVERFGGYSFSTVHVPSTSHGTGFQIGRHEDDFTKADLMACFAIAPERAYRAHEVRKYKDMAHYLKSDPWKSEYVKIER